MIHLASRFFQRKLRSLTIVSAAFVLILVIGAVTFQFRKNMAPCHLAKPVMAAAEMRPIGNAQMNTQSTGSREESTASSSGVSSGKEAPPAYQTMYPDLYAGELVPAAAPKKKTVYLTFDDGPSNLTIPLLNVLDTYHVKATFFVVGHTDRQSLKAMKEIVNRGHAIGVHSYTHQFEQIYASPASFLEDYAKMHDLIKSTTGVDTKIYRYAGGSVNDYNKNTARDIIAEMNRRGYVYYDWNVDSGDAEKGATAKSIYRNVISGVHRYSNSVVLLHNTKFKGNTLKVMAKIIKTLKNESYSFDVLGPSVDSSPYLFCKIP